MYIFPIGARDELATHGNAKTWVFGCFPKEMFFGRILVLMQKDAIKVFPSPQTPTHCILCLHCSLLHSSSEDVRGFQTSTDSLSWFKAESLRTRYG